MSKTVKTLPSPEDSGARVLYYDIETSPNISYTWGKWDQNVIEFEQEWFILSVAYKFAGDANVQVIGMDEHPKYLLASPPNDLPIVKKIHALFDEADVLIAHNGRAFDTKKSQARMLSHGLTPPSPYQEIDTCLVARKHFNFNSNKLDDLANELGVGRKLKHEGFQMWLDCMANNPEAWKKMRKYNKHDVVLLEQIYLKMRPWIEGHPNVALLSGRLESCPRCSKLGTMMRRGLRRRRTMTYQEWQCDRAKGGCGGYSRTVQSEKNESKPQFVN